MAEINFAIIGCGRMAQRHAEIISKTAKLKAVCDIKPDKAKEFAAKYNCTAYTSIDELLENEASIDVISVCTPNSFHSEHTIKSLQADKHVLCEKPMAISVSCMHGNDDRSG